MKLRPLVARSRGLAAAAIAALALGIGLTALMFAIVDGTVRRGLPAPAPGEIVHLERVTAPGEDARPTFLLSERDALREDASMSVVAAYRMSQTNISGAGLTPRMWTTAIVTPDTFAVLGVEAAAGRTFTAPLTPEGVIPVLISDFAWRDQFGAEPSAVGRAVRANGVPAVVAGVMPAGFGFPVSQHVWLPLDERAGATPVALWGRLAPGVTASSAAASLTARHAAARADAAAAPRVDVAPFTAFVLTAQIVDVLEAMFLAGLGVLAIACANVANLLLARGLARRREFAIASALGASRARIVRERLLEGLLLAAPGAAIGVALTYAGAAAFNRAIAATAPPYWVAIAVDARVLAYIVVAAIVTALVAAALPALQSGRAAASTALREETRSATSATLRRTTAGLAIVQVALAAALLACAGLMSKGVAQLSSQQHAFAVDDVITGRVALPVRSYATDEARREFFVSMHTRLQELRAARAAALGSSLPFALTERVRFTLDPRDADQPRWPEAHRVMVTPGYFDAVGVRPLAGRDVEESDREGRARVALVNLSFALTFARREDLIGRPIRIAGADAPITATIVGIVPDLSVGNVRGERPEAIYVPLLQQDTLPSAMSVVARAALDPEAVERELRQAVAEIDPELPLDRVQTLAQFRAAGTWFYRVFGVLFVAFGLGALLLALVGVYAVMSSAVTRRRREIGTRMAFGATGADIARMFLREGVVRLAIGLAAGMLIAAAFTPRLSVFLFHVDPRDASVFMTALAIVGLVGLSACALPALRAARLAPVACLRDDGLGGL